MVVAMAFKVHLFCPHRAVVVRRIMRVGCDMAGSLQSMTDAPFGGLSRQELFDRFDEMQRERLRNPPGWVPKHMRPSSRRSRTVHQMKVTLRDIKPPIWRRIVIPSDYRLDEVAALILEAMGWNNTHLHAFFIGDRSYDQPFPDAPEALDERQFTLREVFDEVGTRMRFDYDFGDGWEHDVVLEAVRLETKAEREPLCLAGKRACPPEDCGGPHGYENLIRIIEEGPSSDWDRELVDWLPPGYDPKLFDAGEATEAMQNLFEEVPWS
jgi:hypothetical protein